jgi:hypothetical protein
MPLLAGGRARRPAERRAVRDSGSHSPSRPGPPPRHDPTPARRAFPPDLPDQGTHLAPGIGVIGQQVREPGQPPGSPGAAGFARQACAARTARNTAGPLPRTSVHPLLNLGIGLPVTAERTVSNLSITVRDVRMPRADDRVPSVNPMNMGVNWLEHDRDRNLVLDGDTSANKAAFGLSARRKRSARPSGRH